MITDQTKPPTPTDKFVALLIAVLVFFVGVWIFQLCWNGSVPKMFAGAKSIDFTVALLFIIVIMLLFPGQYAQSAGYLIN